MITTVILIVIAGVFHGSRDAFHANRKLFETLLNAKPVSFFGSKQDTLKYKSEGVYKNILWKYFPLDFWHVSRWLENIAVAGAIWAITGLWHTFPAYILLVAAGGHFSYWILRKKSKNKI